VSNIGWEEEDQKAVLQVLALKGVTGVEVAPPKVYGPGYEITPAKTASFLALLAPHSLKVTSLQAILFGKTECLLFNTPEQRDGTLTHAKAMVDLAAELGARSIVWGSPKQRQLGQGMIYSEAFSIATAFFRELGAYAASKSVLIAMEANAPAYGCDFCFNVDQAAQLVRAVDSPKGFRLHLDSGCMHMCRTVPRRSMRHGSTAQGHCVLGPAG